jgi:DNA methylase
VWAKTNAGMGSLYRSQHELLPLFKKGTAPHVNNVELGRRGRWRSNVWSYPGASSLGSDARRGLQDHPTVKPTAMLEDALLDLTDRGAIVVDPFLGSGSTLIAADKTGRVCRGIELDPLYVDVILRRYEAAPRSRSSHPNRAIRSSTTGDNGVGAGSSQQNDVHEKICPVLSASPPRRLRSASWRDELCDACERHQKESNRGEGFHRDRDDADRERAARIDW